MGREGEAMLLRETIYQAIRRAILTCEFQPGQELREQVLAERYRVSRSPIRDSLLRLELENLVTVLPRQGYRVKPISMSDVEDVFSLRLLIDSACAAGAAARADEAALRALDRFRGFPNQPYTDSEYVEYNQAFHSTIADLSGNMRMAAVSRDLIEQFERLVRVALRTFKEDAVRRACAEHEAIIDALQAHDAECASRLCYEHTAGAHERVSTSLRLVGQQQENPARSPAANGILYDSD
jgi:GntR family transcriptional regulator, rspAB operon transcriptional repressor